jgi:hypothetical protein
LRLAGHDHRSRLAAAKHAGLAAQVEVGLLPAQAVADGAATQHDRNHIVLRRAGRRFFVVALPVLVGCPFGDPAANGFDFMVGQRRFAVGRHFVVADLEVERAFFGFAGRHDRPRFAPFQ